VALYLGMVPGTIVAMLACARLGAVHCVLFSALPAEALADRLGFVELLRRCGPVERRRFGRPRGQRLGPPGSTVFRAGAPSLAI
jgi:hypothetical protein